WRSVGRADGPLGSLNASTIATVRPDALSPASLYADWIWLGPSPVGPAISSGPSCLAGRIACPRQWIPPLIGLLHPRLTDGPRTGSPGAGPIPRRALAPDTPKAALAQATHSNTADRRAQRAATFDSITSTSRGSKWIESSSLSGKRCVADPARMLDE